MDHENQRAEDGVNAGELNLPPADPQVEDPRHATTMTVVIICIRMYGPNISTDTE